MTRQRLATRGPAPRARPGRPSTASSTPLGMSRCRPGPSPSWAPGRRGSRPTPSARRRPRAGPGSTSQPASRCTGGSPLCDQRPLGPRTPAHRLAAAPTTRRSSPGSPGSSATGRRRAPGRRTPTPRSRRRPGAHCGVRHPLGLPAVGEVADRAALLGDRGAVVADPPVVDDVGQHVEGAGHEGARGRRLVLVADALGPGQAGGVPEGAGEDLVPREDVAEDLGPVRDPQPRARGRAGASSRAARAGRVVEAPPSARSNR